MHLLVTGGAGFIGSNFIRFLLSDATASPQVSKIINLDKLTYAGNPQNLQEVQKDPRYNFVEGGIEEDVLIHKLLIEHHIDAVINFAAESHVDRSIDSPEPFFQTNVIGTLRIVNESLKYWKDLDEGKKAAFRFLHVSTDEVYGTLSETDPAFEETTPFAPNSPYSASKAASDHIVRAYHHTYGMPVITTNCSNNYGPYQFPEKLIPLMILNALEGKNLPIYGDGMNVRDWLYVTDHCSGIWSALLKGKLGETYNIGGKNEKPNIEIVDIICEILDEKLPREDGESYKSQKIFVKDRPGHDRRYAINCSKIETELSWSPSETFETGIRKTVLWYLDNRDWCDNITSGNYARERLGNVK
jgi:dTDP-glucose 4,6-dehydratase